MNAENGRTIITILGSGTCVPSLQRSSCSVLVEIGNQKLLFDVGPGTMRRLLEAGQSIFDISHIFLSHFHPDHSGELVPFLFATQYPDKNQRKKRLPSSPAKDLLLFTGVSRMFTETGSNRRRKSWISSSSVTDPVMRGVLRILPWNRARLNTERKVSHFGSLITGVNQWFIPVIPMSVIAWWPWQKMRIFSSANRRFPMN